MTRYNSATAPLSISIYESFERPHAGKNLDSIQTIPIKKPVDIKHRSELGLPYKHRWPDGSIPANSVWQENGNSGLLGIIVATVGVLGWAAQGSAEVIGRALNALFNAPPDAFDATVAPPGLDALSGGKGVWQRVKGGQEVWVNKKAGLITARDNSGHRVPKNAPPGTKYNEVWSKNGEHLGEYDPATGKQTGPADKRKNGKQPNAIVPTPNRPPVV